MKLFARRLFISDLPPNLTEEDIRETFSKFGSVSLIEIKHRRQITIKNKYPTYAYINLDIDHYNLQQCFEYFTKNKWKGNIVDIQIAKENFLEKLKQEQEENKLLKNNNEKMSPAIDILHDSVNKKHSLSLDSLNDRPTKEECSIEESKSLSSEEEMVLPKTKILNSSFTKPNNIQKEINTIENPKCENIENVDTREKVVIIADQKRINSIREMKKSYWEKKNAIKIALMNVDAKVNNKVIFDDEDCEEQTAIYKSDKKIENNTNKNILFQEDDDEEEIKYNFDVKEQFQGTKGRKLMGLQLKFKNDKRFKMDERFLEDDHISAIEDDEQDNRESIHNVDQDEEMMEVTTEEKQKELSILKEVLGNKLIKNKDKEAKNIINKSIGMVRYDPTNPEHSKYIIKQDKQIKGKLKGNREKAQVNAETVTSERPEVSKETFYKVQENLKEALNEDKSFSILSLFGSKKEPDNREADVETNQNNHIDQSSYKTNEKNPFRYESSDEEYDHEEGTKEIDEVINKNSGQNVSLGPTKLWREPFFFKQDDYRFQEGIDFVRRFALDDDEEFKQVRRNIKEIVRAKVKNNLRKNKPFRKKLGGKRLIKIKKAMKNR